MWLLLVLLMTLWTSEERDAWAPPQEMTVSEWADASRVLPAGVSSEPGPWRTDRTPYLRAIQDAMGDRWVEEITLMKSPQVGGSEATRNAKGYWACQDPAPCLVVYPSEQSAKEVLNERVIPMFRTSPALQRVLTGSPRDLQLHQVNLRTMSIYAGWAGAPQSLATRPCRYVICDEVDKYPPFSGREADPVSLAEARTRTYGHRRKLVLVSTPTTKLGLINQAWEGCPVRLKFHLPCPACQKLQPLTWSRMRWGHQLELNGLHGGPCPDDSLAREKLAIAVELGHCPVTYACIHCSHRFDETTRHTALAKGVWLNQHNEVYEPGCSTRVAFHISSLYSPWVSWKRIVVEYLRSRLSPQLMMNFMNNWLGEPYEEQLHKLEGSIFVEKSARGQLAGTVPTWARYVLASVDTGGQDAWFTIRAWGPGYRSLLLAWGHCWNLEEVFQKVLQASFEVEGLDNARRHVDLLGIDSGGTTSLDETGGSSSRTDQVYKFSMRDRRIAALKGFVPVTGNAGQAPVNPRRVTYRPQGDAPYDVVLNLINVHHYKDVLAARVPEVMNGTDLWQLPAGIDEEYCKHMTSEQCVLEREGRKVKRVWRPLAKGVPNHLWDCEVYQSALADMIRVDLLGPEASKVTKEKPLELPQAPAHRPVSKPNPIKPAPQPKRGFISRK